MPLHQNIIYMRNAKHLVQVYGPVVDKPENRALIHCEQYRRSYEMALAAVANNQEFIDDSEPRSDLCTECEEIAVSAILMKHSDGKQRLCQPHLAERRNS